MPDGQLKETLYGNKYKWEVYYKSGFIADDSYTVYRDGERWKVFGSLSKAMDAIKAAD